MKYLLAIGALFSTQAFAGNCEQNNYISLNKKMCTNGECVIYSVTTRLDKNVTQAKIVRNRDVYVDPNLRFIGNYGDEKVEIISEVEKTGNTCRQTVRIMEPAFDMLKHGFDEVTGPDCRVADVATPMSQTLIGLFVTILTKQVSMTCDQIDGN